MFSNDKGIKESHHSSSEHRESYDMIRSLQNKMFFRKEDKSIANQKSKLVKSTRAKRATYPKKNNNETRRKEKILNP